MKKVILLSVALLLVFLTSVIAHLPAQVALNYLPLPSQLTLSDVSGTLWKGQAKRVVWQNNKLGDLQWDLALFKLLAGKAEAHVRFGRGSEFDVTVRGFVGYGFAGPYAENLIVSAPAETLLKVAPSLPVPLTLAGKVDLSIKSMLYAPPYCQTAQGDLVWEAGKILTPLADLNVGRVVLEFSCQDSKVVLKGGQSSQHVSSEADITLEPTHRYQASAWFKPEADFPTSLTEQLKWLPSPNGEGQYLFNYQGRL
ncbi:type II secretion system protein N [Vibrio ostreicida]|uniref:Type II secretion system protein N n=1 Tax=Vibrio ostreicida TaxID=526588 RepID=A0ABT8BNS5_9VIBR|nr:type II secretion system protein N [Vibrio ostreicida]MDN3608553.1 type II secretion system protein N [Vibrio ostreicida]NPD10685.1 type II secretion system protein N [Vibrio ostreicida]